ncbi:hypothetical protein TNCV_2941761 [Trichonephila clavipes]|nr:hypothetical protein TNCV_2941761 [Trichonephila clavipes]
MRRNEGRVVNTPLVFKRVLFEGKRRRPGREEKKSGENGWKEKGEEMAKEKERESGRERESGAHFVWRRELSPGLEWKDDERRWR